MLSRSTATTSASSPARESVTEARRQTAVVAGGPGVGSLRPHEIHVWRARLDLARCDLDFISQCLSGEEWTRAHRFRFGVYQDRYIAGRAILRTLLGRYLGSLPEKVSLSQTEWGKPILGGDMPFHFNVSHSEDLMLIALSPSPIGIDVEHIRPLDELDMMAKSVFSPEELDLWRRLKPEAKLESFFRLWTRKEALLKGIGLGITEHTQTVSVFFDTESDVATPPHLTNEKWIVRSFERVPWQIAAVATPVREPIFVEREFTSADWL